MELQQTKIYKINEIFYSLQGEGARRGHPTLFVRFSGCNLACPFCDTDHNKTNYTLTASELVNKMKEVIKLTHGVDFELDEFYEYIGDICFTGGEPTLQLCGELLREIVNGDDKTFTNAKLTLETNGLYLLKSDSEVAKIHSLFGIYCVDVVISPKFTQMKKDDIAKIYRFLRNVKRIVTYTVELKIVFPEVLNYAPYKRKGGELKFIYFLRNQVDVYVRKTIMPLTVEDVNQSLKNIEKSMELVKTASLHGVENINFSERLHLIYNFK